MSDELREAEGWERPEHERGRWGARLEIKNPGGNILDTEFYLDGLKLRGVTACTVEWAYEDAPVAHLTVKVQDVDIDHEALLQLLATQQGEQARERLIAEMARGIRDALKAEGIG